MALSPEIEKKKKIYNNIILVVRTSAHVSDMSSHGACMVDLGSSLASVVPSLPLIEAKKIINQLNLHLQVNCLL